MHTAIIIWHGDASKRIFRSLLHRSPMVDSGTACARLWHRWHDVSLNDTRPGHALKHEGIVAV